MKRHKEEAMWFSVYVQVRSSIGDVWTPGYVCDHFKGLAITLTNSDWSITHLPSGYGFGEQCVFERWNAAAEACQKWCEGIDFTHVDGMKWGALPEKVRKAVTGLHDAALAEKVELYGDEDGECDGTCSECGCGGEVERHTIQ